MLETFLNYLQYELRVSNHTILSYKNDITQFCSFLDNTSSNPTSAQYLDLRAWIISLVEKGNSPKTVNRKICALKAFYNFLLKSEFISKDPTFKIRLLKTKKSIPHFAEEEKLVDILENSKMEALSSDFIRSRNNLVLEILYGTGIRLTELINLKKENIYLYESVLRVVGKRNKERIVPINNVLLDSIKDYLELRINEFPDISHDYLIITKKGRPSYPKLIYNIVNVRLKEITNLEKRSPHILRHTFATHLLDNGADLNAIKDLLGHTSLAATQVYTHNSLEKLKAIFDQAHPKA